MKRLLCIGIALILCLSVCGCTAATQNEKTLVRAKLSGWGKEVILEMDEELQKLQSMLDSIEYSVHELRSDSLAPGSQSLVIKMEFSDGETEVITLPFNVVGDKLYVAPAEINSLFAEAFF